MARGIAKEFATEGASVVVNYASAKQDADRVVDEISKRGGKAIAIQCNVAKKAEVERLFAEAEKAFGKIDILVNNAGVYDWSPIEEITEEQFHKHFDVNVLGLLLATQEAVKQFASNGGNIINISSTVTSLTPPGSSVYTGTKGAVDAITRTLAKELGPREIRVNSINPGLVETEGCAQPVSTKAIFGKALKRRHHWVVSVNPRTSLLPQSFLLPLIPRGSQVKHFVSREVFVRIPVHAAF